MLPGLGGNQPGGHLPRKHLASQPLDCGSERRLHGVERFGRCYRARARKTVEQNTQTIEMVEMGMRYIDGLKVAVMQSDSIRQSIGLSDGQHRVYQHRVVLAKN
jgi:hypothetical protein